MLASKHCGDHVMSSRQPDERDFSALTVAELVDLARHERIMMGREDDSCRCIHELWRRADRETLESATLLCGSSDPLDRELACDILIYLGRDPYEPVFYDEAMPLLVRLLVPEEPVDVLYSALHAIVNYSPWDRDDLRPLPAILALSSHGDELVRFSAAKALGGCEEPEAIATLLRLSRDPDVDIRDWATFGLSRLLEVDTPEIRAAFWERVDDEHEEVRAEALSGLARCKVPGTYEALVAELDRNTVHDTTFKACEMLADPRLLQILQNWHRILGEGTSKCLGEVLRSFQRSAERTERNDDVD